MSLRVAIPRTCWLLHNKHAYDTEQLDVNSLIRADTIQPSLQNVIKKLLTHQIGATAFPAAAAVENIVELKGRAVPRDKAGKD